LRSATRKIHTTRYEGTRFR